MHLSLNQRGISQIILPLFILAAIGLTVYLVQQQTNVIPHAETTTAPTGCQKVTPVSRSICYKKSATSAPEQCRQSDREQPHEFKEYPIKEVTWTFSNGWKNVGGKGEDQADGDRMSLGSMPSRFDSPSGKSFEKIDNDPISSNGTTRDGEKIGYRVKGGSAVVEEFAYTKVGTNFQGVTTNPDGTPATTYDKDKSYAFVPTDESSGVRCDGVGTATNTGSNTNNAACTNNNGAQCKSGVCSNSTCVQGAKKGTDSCTNKEECESNTCTNGKCSGGSLANGKACNDSTECASNKCDPTTNKCVSAIATPTPTPKSTSGSNGSGSTASTAPGASATASGSPAASVPVSSASPAPSGSPANVSLTKAEITGFNNSYKALAARLGTASSSGNLHVVSGIAGSELDSIVSQLSTCPDDANVGPCLDSKFLMRFGFAKTAARLTAFYAIFNNISGLCVKSDFGLNPLITAVSTTNETGRVNLCTEPTAAQKIWRIFVNNKFEPVLVSDTRWPANPTCASLPADVLTHFHNAETLFSSQSGFIPNTLCDGKTSVGPEGSASPAP